VFNGVVRSFFPKQMGKRTNLQPVGAMLALHAEFLNADTELSRKSQHGCCDFAQNRIAMQVAFGRVPIRSTITQDMSTYQGRIHSAVHGSHVSVAPMAAGWKSL
jgi:hypothetical protein